MLTRIAIILVPLYEHYKHNTRSIRFNYLMPKIEDAKSTTFYNNAIQDWNLLPDSIKSITDLQMFKKEDKCHLKCTSEELEMINIFF